VGVANVLDSLATFRPQTAAEKLGQSREGQKDRESIENWQMNTYTMGLYGNFYLKRAIIALIA
jgi:hypothetical protein